MMLVFIAVAYKLGAVFVPFKMSADLISAIFKISVI